MSTRAFIGVREQSGSVSAVYNHNDGYPAYVGCLLLTCYPNEVDARALVALGDISHLGERLAPEGNEWHGFDSSERAPGVTVAYHRDRGEPFRQSTVTCTTEFLRLAKNSWGRYAYLFDCNLQQWLCSDLYGKTLKPLVPLTETICECDQ